MTNLSRPGSVTVGGSSEGVRKFYQKMGGYGMEQEKSDSGIILAAEILLIFFIGMMAGYAIHQPVIKNCTIVSTTDQPAIMFSPDAKCKLENLQISNNHIAMGFNSYSWKPDQIKALKETIAAAEQDANKKTDKVKPSKIKFEPCNSNKHEVTKS